MKKDGTLYKYEQALLNSYNNARETHLLGCYTRPSVNKQRAFHYCEDVRKRLGGFDRRIPSHNTFTFSYAFIYPDAETGELKLYYDTGKTVYDFSIGGARTNARPEVKY